MMFLILIDAHSTRIDEFYSPSTTLGVANDELRTVFVRLRIPETMVIDNGTNFESAEFKSLPVQERHSLSIPPQLHITLLPVASQREPYRLSRGG